MREHIINRIQERFQSYTDLVQSTAPEDFAKKPDVAKSKSLGEHLWCVVGARESYTKALEAGSWQGFACSLQALEKPDIEAALKSSAESFQNAIQELVRSQLLWPARPYFDQHCIPY